MNIAIPCVRCGRVFTIALELTGRTVRCKKCGQIQRIPITPSSSEGEELKPVPDVYALAPESPAFPLAKTPKTAGARQDTRTRTARQARSINWHGFVRAGVGESSPIALESVGLIALSAADVLVTYALLCRGPAFYESNPVAQWFFVRWNIAGMAVFKFSAMGLVVAIGEIVERHRPGWGRSLVVVSCLATAAVVLHGLRLLLAHGDSGALVD